MQNIKLFLANLSHHPGIYQMIGEKGEILYVGKAKDLKKRVASYFSQRSKDLKTLSLLEHIKDIQVTITHNESEAMLLECNLIKQYKPKYNVLLRDDKSYPYILITAHHNFPRIDLYRGARKKNGLYFGPYPSASSVRETINLLQKVFKIRTCRDSFFEARTRPCLLYEIDRCTGPCVGLIDKEDYARNVELAVLFLQGKNEIVLQALLKRMEAASKDLNFEQAAQYRDQITRLRQIQERQHIHVGESNADIIGLAIEGGVISVQLLSFRNGRMLDSRSYFPKVPTHVSAEEVIAAFITQHYVSDVSHIDSIPQQIIIEFDLLEVELMQNALSELACHKVEIIKPHRGEKKKWLTMATQNAKQSLNTHLISKTNASERMRALKKVLGLKSFPNRIECYDISHSAGEATVASCVVFTQEGAQKSNYRRFNITQVTPGDDVAAMHQVLLRRFKRLQKEEVDLPSLVLIDGGITQLNAAKKVMLELDIHELVLLGVSKGPDRKAAFETLHLLPLSASLVEKPVQEHSFHLPKDSLALHFIQQIRDEAHRFAITGHRKQRDKVRRHSALELIPGIGAKRRRELLRYFGGIQGLAHASLDELTKVPGISRSLAERIFSVLHDTTV